MSLRKIGQDMYVMSYVLWDLVGVAGELCRFKLCGYFPSAARGVAKAFLHVCEISPD